MASETNSSNELSQQVVFSGNIAKSRRSKNSSKFSGRHKERKRSPEKSYGGTDSSEDDAAAARTTQSFEKERYDDDGYSSLDVRSEGRSDTMIRDEDSTTGWGVFEQRIRKRSGNTASEGFEVFGTSRVGGDPAADHSTEWELVDGCAKESDVSLTTANETSEDDFWKCESGGGGAAAHLIPKEKKTTKKKRRKSSARFKFLAVVRNAVHEWRLFVGEERDELVRLKRLRNKCAVGLLLIFIFCGIGGIIFHSVEGAFEMFYKCGVKRVKRDFLDSLWTKSHYMREDEWKSLARSKLMEFENQLYDAYDAGMTSYSGQKGWSFLNSFVYCITVVTTVGYGHIAPATTLGRMITIVYSLFGIPLFLILLADYGKMFTRIIKFFWAYVRRLYYTGSCRKVRKTAPVQEMFKGVRMVFDMTKLRKSSTTNKDAEVQFTCPETPALSAYTIDDEFNLPISVAVGILLLYMLSGAVLFMRLEKWNFFESFYFVYISVSTIGFGDIVPSSTVTVLICSLIYFVFGLALTSMCINVITEKLTDSFRQATAKIGTTMGMEIAEDSLDAAEKSEQDLGEPT